MDDVTLEVYYEGLERIADPEPWDKFVKRASADDTFRGPDGVLRFPKLPDLIDAYQYVPREEPKFTALPPIHERLQEISQGMEIFKRELRKHGMDVDELVRDHSWPGGRGQEDRQPGEEG